ncbi:MAG: metal ABC transporter permease [Limisphaerales bacterium]
MTSTLFNDFLNYGFLGRALVAGLLMSVTCGLLSPFVVLRRLSFSADGLAHASLGRLALGLFLLEAGPVPTLASYAVSFVFTCLVAAGIAYFSGSQRVHSDTAVGACYVAAFALGILLLSTRKRYSGHLEHFFFGSLLAVNPLECWLLGGLCLLTALLCFAGWRWLAGWTFDEELARAGGVPTAALRYALILLIAATVILSTKVVGVLIVTAMLILPGAVGTLLGRRMSFITLLSLGVALTSTLNGLALSNSADVPPGPAIVLMTFACFVAAYLLRRHRDRRLSHSNFHHPHEHAA